MVLLDNKLLAFTKKVADLPDQPQMTATQLKEWFDAAVDELRTKYNSAIDTIISDYATKSDMGSVKIDTISTDSDGAIMFGQNCYKVSTDTKFRYLTDHASMGARGIVLPTTSSGTPYFFDTGNITTTKDAEFTPTLKKVLTQTEYDVLFQYANNGKTNWATVIGSPLLATDTFAQLNSKTQNLKLSMALNLTNMGVSAGSNETLNNLISKILSISTGKKYATGTATTTTSQDTGEGLVHSLLSVSGLSFTPRIVYTYKSPNCTTLYVPMYSGSMTFVGYGSSQIWNYASCGYGNFSAIVYASIGSSVTWYAWE